MAEFFYPPVNFHFRVEFLLSDVTDNDIRFRDISGLTISNTTRDLREGGENRFVYQLPEKIKYSDLTLNRGMTTNSGVIDWVKDQFDTFRFRPVDLLITLLNQDHEPLRAWQVVKAFPKNWEISKFDAMNQDYVVEKLVLGYQYFKIIELDNAANS